jgi:hypothetical protein
MQRKKLDAFSCFAPNWGEPSSEAETVMALTPAAAASLFAERHFGARERFGDFTRLMVAVIAPDETRSFWDVDVDHRPTFSASPEGAGR